ncbi:STAS-like domain-containing protein [Sphingomonas mali]|uniref:STAS-like domain-containing protein n=1 Tax=Sphingomonas mali TaxID=40682 RepID=UPI00082E1388|nr:STAS-like domain-containing protein [Sphingomonas mali]
MSRTLEPTVIDVAADFTRFPGGRYKSDGIFSGERFREECLVPALDRGAKVVIKLDGTMGYGSSFLEEAFGGVVRSGRFTPQELQDRLVLETSDPSLYDEIVEYLTSAIH